MSLRRFRFFPLLAVLLMAGLAAGAAPTPAWADDLYTVAGVHVDATAASPAEALNSAIAQGRPKAFQTLYRRLTRQQDWGRQPSPDPATLVRLSRSYTIANERRSTTRYVADVTYLFNADAVARYLKTANIAFTQVSTKRILLVPFSPNFAIGPWAQALAAPALHDSVVPFAVATTADAPALNGLNFDSAGWSDVAAAASRIGATEAALVQSVYANGKVTVNIRRIGLGETPAKSSVDVPLVQTLGTTYPAAAQAAVRAIEDLWKSRAAIDFGQKGKLAAAVRVSSAAQWGAVQSALSSVDTVTGVQVTAMDIGYAQLVISYLGAPDQLRDALAAAGLTLGGHAGDWTLGLAAGGAGQ